MRVLLTIFILFYTSHLFSDDKVPAVKWLTNIDVALKESKENKKPILMVFSGSDWCQSCIKLKENVLSTNEFKKYANDNLVLLLLDFPSEKGNALPADQQKHNEKLSEKYNTEGKFPFLVFLNNDEKVLGTISGYKKGTSDEVINKMKNILAPKQ